MLCAATFVAMQDCTQYQLYPGTVMRGRDRAVVKALWGKQRTATAAVVVVIVVVVSAAAAVVVIVVIVSTTAAVVVVVVVVVCK